MGLFQNEEKKEPTDFVLGVTDIFPLVNSEDLVVVGYLKGTVHVGDAVYVSNHGDDEGGFFLSTVVGIEIGPNNPRDEATDCQAALRIEMGEKHGFKIGTVLHTRNTTVKDVHDAYIRALGDGYVIRKNMEFTEDELLKLSMTDCAEVWRLCTWLWAQSAKNETEKDKLEHGKKLENIGNVLAKKLLSAKAVYCVYNKKTGEPHMFSRTVRQGEGYMCTAPNIMVFTECYQSVLMPAYTTEKFEVKKIENGEKGDGIYNFLGSTFYLNGACGVTVINKEAEIPAKILVTPPDFSEEKEINIPVMNPNLERWLLLMGQMGMPESDDEKTIYNLYYRFMGQELVKAKLLVPMKKLEEALAPDENGKVTLKKDTAMSLAVQPGKGERSAVRMYTDWKRFRMTYGEDWGGMIQPVEGMIDVMDCAINATEFPAAGCYIGKEMFEQMKNL